MSEQSPIKEENNNEISESIENVTETQNQNSEKKFESQSNKNLNESENNKESQNIKQEDDPESKKKKEKQEQSLDGKNKKIEKEKEEELIEEELSDNDGSTSVVTNSSETPETDNSNDKTPEKKGRPIFSKEKESILLREKRKQQEKKDKNRVRYLTEEEINLAFKWFTKGDSVISSRDIKECFDTFFTDLSRNDKKYYVSGNIKNDTRHLVNIKEEKIQSEMFSTTQTISSLKKMLLRYPFKIKDYDNAFSVSYEFFFILHK